jgi:hypothetical protein
LQRRGSTAIGAGSYLQVFFFLFLLVEAGCEQPPIPSEPTAKADNDFNRLSIYTRYASVKINILPLTEFIDVGDAQQAKINLYVSLLDLFGSQIKSPGIFRFELYERVLRSADPKGKRVVIWQDIDLTDPVKNNDHWRDFLRAYEFNLPFKFKVSNFKLPSSQSYILQATCLCPSGKRLSAEFTLKRTK